MSNYFNPGFIGYGYGQARPQPRFTQPLTQEQINLLQQQGSFDMKVSNEERLASICTHRELNTGASTLVANADGSHTCSICGATFTMREYSAQEVQEAVRVITDILQTSKTLYVDMPEQLAANYYQMLPLLSRLPALWNQAVKNISKYEQYLGNNLNSFGPYYSGFDAMNRILTNPYGYQQPYYPGYGAPQMAPQMMGNPMAVGTPGVAPTPMGQVAPVQQPMGAPMGAPMMQMPMAGYGYDMNQVVPQQNPMATGVPTMPVAPTPGVMPEAAAAPQGEVQQQQTFNV